MVAIPVPFHPQQIPPPAPAADEQPEISALDCTLAQIIDLFRPHGPPSPKPRQDLGGVFADSCGRARSHRVLPGVAGDERSTLGSCPRSTRVNWPQCPPRSVDRLASISDGLACSFGWRAAAVRRRRDERDSRTLRPHGPSYGMGTVADSPG